MSGPTQPLRFLPVYRDYPWGGDRIRRLYGRSLRPGVYAESWELSDRPEGMSVAAEGPFGGRSLGELCERYPESLLGRLGPAGARFPILVKIIDARQRLSVQVHPSERSAAVTGGEPKTEMWYVLAAGPGARVYAGFRDGVGPAEFERALTERRLPEILNEIPVRVGDAVLIPGGLVHAIGDGCLMLEIQQNSNTTYRLYDWDRAGPNGVPRDLHVEPARRSIAWESGATRRRPPRPGKDGTLPAGVRPLADGPYFRVEEWPVTGSTECEHDGSGFQAVFVVSGCAAFRTGDESVEAGPGTTLLLPAALRRVGIEAPAGATLVRIRPAVQGTGAGGQSPTR